MHTFLKDLTFKSHWWGTSFRQWPLGGWTRLRHGFGELKDHRPVHLPLSSCTLMLDTVLVLCVFHFNKKIPLNTSFGVSLRLFDSCFPHSKHSASSGTPTWERAHAYPDNLHPSTPSSPTQATLKCSWVASPGTLTVLLAQWTPHL